MSEKRAIAGSKHAGSPQTCQAASKPRPLPALSAALRSKDYARECSELAWDCGGFCNLWLQNAPHEAVQFKGLGECLQFSNRAMVNGLQPAWLFQNGNHFIHVRAHLRAAKLLHDALTHFWPQITGLQPSGYPSETWGHRVRFDITDMRLRFAHRIVCLTLFNSHPTMLANSLSLCTTFFLAMRGHKRPSSNSGSSCFRRLSRLRCTYGTPGLSAPFHRRMLPGRPKSRPPSSTPLLSYPPRQQQQQQPPPPPQQQQQPQRQPQP